MNKKQRSVDKKLVLDYQSGNTDALQLLVKRWHKTLCKKAYWLVKDPDVAKDIAQDSWQIIISKLNQLQKPESFGSWASRIVYTKSLDWMKTKSNRLKKLENYNYKQDRTEVKETKNDNLKTALLNAVKKLPKKQQTVISLFYAQEYTLVEISDILKISVGTAKSRLFHAREKIKQILKHNNYEN
ncbi:MAG: RNA polymerase sigma factor [Flaviramulus sp.]|nr:RNA polymerase sigma factor [Flaviramulus sp.]NNC51234.1 RNA polymerase sigma factor [Flaviramulus sp.]